MILSCYELTTLELFEYYDDDGSDDNDENGVIGDDDDDVDRLMNI